MSDAYTESFHMGANLPKLVDLIATQAQVVMSESEKDLGTIRMDIRDALNLLRQERPVLMEAVLDVYVTAINGTMLGSLNDRTDNEGKPDEDVPLPQPLPVNQDILKQLAAGVIYVGDLSHRYHGQRASVIMVPYARDWRLAFRGDIYEQVDDLALIQVIYSTENAWSLLNVWRMRHLLYVLATSFVLQLIIVTLAMIQMVSRPFQQVITALERAEEGELEIQTPINYSDSGIERLVLSLYRMLNKMRTAQRARIDELGTLAAGLAHEIGNPLNVIAMRAEYLKRRLRTSKPTPQIVAEIQDSLDTVMEEVDAIKQVTRQFADLTRPLVIRPQPTNVNQLLDSVLNSMSVAAKKVNVDIVRQYAQLPMFSVDSGKLRQATLNLIQNAIQAMATRGGRLYVATSTKQGITGERLVITIRDTGPGMPTGVIEHIFEAYFTTRESEGGLGLGLPITRQIVQAHDGQIEVRSQEGMGTVFSISLPIPGDQDEIEAPQDINKEDWQYGEDSGRG